MWLSWAVCVVLAIFPLLSSSVRLLSMAGLTNAVCKSLVICGPSGVGKSTLIGRLLASHPSKFGLSVSHTSRKPRVGEVDGVHYHFVSREFMENDIACGEIKYIEHAEVHSNLYGTRSDAVSKVHDEGKVCILDVDRRGVMQIKKSGLLAKYLFVAPKSIDLLEARLRTRGTETEEQITLRLNNAKAELQYGLSNGNFDEVLVNDKLDVAYRSLVDNIRRWFPFLHL
jgi:guanylate kinase